MDDNFEKIMGNKSVCGYKWAWSTVRLQQGLTCGCHRTEHDTITPDTLHTFHNTPIKIKTRQLMLDGKWPGLGCEYCQHIEIAGAISDRMESNENIVGKFLPPEILKNPIATHVSPTMVEVYFSNLCNMSCIYCSDKYSTVWEQENIKYNDPNRSVITPVDSKEYAAMVAAFFAWLDTNISTLAELNVLGGEPFFQPELNTMMEFLESHPSPNLELRVFSNLKVSQPKLSKILSKLEQFVVDKKLKSVELIASIDCWGPEQEYIRTGLSLHQWENNFAFVVKNYQNVKIHIHSTITCLTIPTVTGLIEKINYYNDFRLHDDIIYTADFVVSPHCLSPMIFPMGYFDKFYDDMSAISTDSEALKLQGRKNTINASSYRPELVVELKQFLDTLDSRRNTNWRSVFPWLDEFDEGN